MNTLFKPKFFVVLRQGYNWFLFKKDFWAGIVVAIVALPLVIAFAVFSGVSPEKGVITAVIAGSVVALLGGSRFQISGPSAALIVISYGIIQQYGLIGLIISTFLAGMMLILLGILRLGIIIKYIPHPLIVGFTSGVALLVFTSELRDIFAFQIDQIPAGFGNMWLFYFSHLDLINYYAFGTALFTIVIVVISNRIIKNFSGYFMAMVIVTILVSILQFPIPKIHDLFGEIPNTFTFEMPHLEWGLLKEYVHPAFAIAILCAIESLLSAVVADGMSGGNHRSNTELIAQGSANLIIPFFGGLPAMGAVGRTVINIKKGARTPVAALIHSLFLLVLLGLMSQWIGRIPLACLAGILIVVAFNMIERRTFFMIRKGSRYDNLVLFTVFFLTVFVDLTLAIEVGMVFSAMLFMERMSKLSNIESVDIDTDILENYSQLPVGVDVYEITGPFFFGAAQTYKEALKEIAGDAKVLILRMRHVPFIDATGVLSFKEVVQDLHSRKVSVILSGVRPEVEKTLSRNGLVDMLGAEAVCESFGDAVKLANQKLEKQMLSKLR